MLLWRAAPLLLFIAAVGRSKVQGNSLQKIRYDLESYQGTLRQLSQYVTQADRHLMWADRDDFKQWVENNKFNEEPFKTQLTEEWFRDLGDKLSGIQYTLQNIQNDIRSMGVRHEGLDGRLEGLVDRVTVIEETIPVNVKDSLHTIKSRVSGTELTTEQVQPDKPRVWVTVIVGGTLDDNSYTAAVEVFGGDSSLTLPSYPSAVCWNRMTAIDSTIINCGGWVDGKPSKNCLILDLNRKHKTWQKSQTFSRAGHHHISAANDAIMAIFQDGSISVNRGNDSTTYEGFDQGSTNWKSCLAHNTRHSYFFHLGIVYMNDDTTDPANWKNISTIDISGAGVACFMFETELFITRMEKLFIMNTDTFAVRQGASPNTPRYYHGMGVIDGQVAVLGGNGGPYLDNIETYDSQSNTWQTHHKKLLQPKYAFGIVSLLL